MAISLIKSPKGPYKPKYQYLISKRGKVGLKHPRDTKAFMEYLNDMKWFYSISEECYPRKKRKNINSVS